MTTKNLEDDPTALKAAEMLITAVHRMGLSREQAIEALFAALTACAYLEGWTFVRFKEWFLASGEATWDATLAAAAAGAS